MRNHVFLPAAALGAGVVGFGVRKWQWLSAYDYDTELFVHGSPATYLLIGLLAALAAVLLVLLRQVDTDRPLPPVCPNPGYMAAMAAGAFLFFGAAVLGLLEGMEQLQLWQIGVNPVASYPVALLLCGGLCLLSGLATLVLGKAGYRPEQPLPLAGILANFPPFAMLVWLFATHQSHATDPVFLRYGPYLTAAGLLLMAHYDVAAFYQRQGRPRRFLFCTLMGTALALISLADGLSMFQMAMAAACALSALAQYWALLSPVTTEL